jgi:predicted dehydrogenase
LGWIGRQRLDGIAGLDTVRVAALLDEDAERLASAAHRYREAVPCTDLAQLLDRELDGVVIATPNGLHAEQAIACLSRGVAVFCQKPLATRAADAARVLDAARQADRLLGVDFSYRHVAGMSELRRRILAGDLGTIRAVSLVFHNAYGPDKRWCLDPQLAGGGCLLDLGSHLIDLASWLLGHPPLRLVAQQLYCADAVRAAGVAAAADGAGSVAAADGAGRVAAAGAGAPDWAPGAIEELALVHLASGQGTAVDVACSWHAHAGRDALIEMQVFGSMGGAAWRNVGGSFHDFEVETYQGTFRHRLGNHPDAWGPRALAAWIDRLAVDGSFDHDAMALLQGAQLIDQAYAR